MGRLRWQGTAPKRCDICKEKLEDYFVDGKTRIGPWAIMCKKCFEYFGIGFGIGRGQKYTILRDKIKN
jgi:hypothetical protein